MATSDKSDVEHHVEVEDWLQTAFQTYSPGPKCIVYSEPFFRGDKRVFTATNVRVDWFWEVKSIKICNANVTVYSSFNGRARPDKSPIYKGLTEDVPYCNFILESIYFD